MFRRLFSLLLLSLWVLPVAAQTPAAPNYLINVIESRVVGDGARLEVVFGVQNVGSGATSTATVQLLTVGVDEARVVAETSLRPLGGNLDRESNLVLSAPMTLLSPGEVQQFRIVARGEDVPESTRSFSLQIPDVLPNTSSPVTTPVVDVNALLNSVRTLLQDGRNRLLLLGLGASVLLILVLLFRLLRLMFQRPPKFGTWQAPYANLPPLDPNSTLGRRQSWQQHAQNNVIAVPPQPGALAATKMLLGFDGRYLSGWRVLAIRMTQYDMYGRVSRSQVLASRVHVNRLNRLTRRAGQIPLRRLERQVRPIAKAMAREIRRKITPRSALLPIALDVRLQGAHGEVIIMFEIFQFGGDVWQSLEQWQPEMVITGKAIYESYTYTIFGQTGGESLRDFRRRLPIDITRVLVQFIVPRIDPLPIQTPVGTPATNPSVPAVDSASPEVEHSVTQPIVGQTAPEAPVTEGGGGLPPVRG